MNRRVPPCSIRAAAWLIAAELVASATVNTAMAVHQPRESGHRLRRRTPTIKATHTSTRSTLASK